MDEKKLELLRKWCDSTDMLDLSVASQLVSELVSDYERLQCIERGVKHLINRVTVIHDTWQPIGVISTELENLKEAVGK